MEFFRRLHVDGAAGGVRGAAALDDRGRTAGKRSGELSLGFVAELAGGDLGLGAAGGGGDAGPGLTLLVHVTVVHGPRTHGRALVRVVLGILVRGYRLVAGVVHAVIIGV